MKKFTTTSFGQYETKIMTSKGAMSATLFYKAGDDLPDEIRAKFKKNGKDYVFCRWARKSDNSWLFNHELNAELFAEIKKDWEEKCREFLVEFSTVNYIADRGSLLVRSGSSTIIFPNGIGDGEFTLTICGKLPFNEIIKLYKFGYREVAGFNGDIAIGSNDCGTGMDIYRATGDISLFLDKNGNFAVVLR